MTFPRLSLKPCRVWEMCGVSPAPCLPLGRGGSACGWEEESLGECPGIGKRSQWESVQKLERGVTGSVSRYWHPKLMRCKVRVVLGVFKTKVVQAQILCLQAQEFLRDVGAGGQEDGLELLLLLDTAPFPPPRAQLTPYPAPGPSLCPVTTTAPECPGSITRAKLGQCGAPSAGTGTWGPPSVPSKMGDALLERSLLGMRAGTSGSAVTGHPERCTTSPTATPAPSTS